MIVGVFAKLRRTDFAPQLADITAWMVGRGHEVLVDEQLAEDFELADVVHASRESIVDRAELLIVFGGDGTMLSVARLIRDRESPLLGVNLGTLGFLTEVVLDDLHGMLEKVLVGDFETESRSLVEARLLRKGSEQGCYHALNDVVINKAALARVINIDAHFDGNLLANFVSDGIIISTPTGSTAYSLSAGGPIVHPNLDALLLTPICPHTLTNRPVVVPSDHEIRLTLASEEDVMLTVDGQVGVTMLVGDQLVCTRSPYRVKLVRPQGREFFGVLREKLKWSER